MKAYEMTLGKFDQILPKLNFQLLTYPMRYGFEGAGPRCLFAESEDGIVLLEHGSYWVYGYDDSVEEGDSQWCVCIDAETGATRTVM